MKIKSVVLDNIRSYVQQEVVFPENSVLLSGNIGSGKSTILLAMEFALFGLMRGTLTGAALLRNGAERGSVKFEFQVKNKDVTIYRSLKRTKSSIVQDTGWIEVNGIRKEATAIELKQKVLELLNYPLELLTKNKLLFRYTVYTPQEEMKHILFCDQEERLDILRKVFGVEKYKRITANAQLIASKLREKMRETAGYIADLEKKQDDKKSKEKEIMSYKEELEKVLTPIKTVKEKTLATKSNLIEIETKMNDLNSAQKELASTKIDLEHTLKESTRLKEEAETLEKETKELETLKTEDVSQEINKKKLDITAAEKTIRDLVREIQELKVKKEHSNEIITKISEINECPTCLQQVPEQHKNGIKVKEEDNVSKILPELENKVKQEMAKGQELERLKAELDNLRLKEKEYAVAKERMNKLEEKKIKLNKTLKLQNETKLRIGTLNSAIQIMYDKIESFGNLQEAYAKAKQDYEAVAEDQKRLEVEKVRLETMLSALSSELKVLEEEIEVKQKKKVELENIKQLEQWITTEFVNLMSAMEKSIMFKVHEGFSSLFERWFGLLIQSDLIKVVLDEYFTPKIEQNGYDIEYSFLSGGEKTAVALAYRLALNQVINNMMSEIRTRDIIILDEPTDGFSSEQLDRMRILLEELKVGQLVIVSHEPKIESFVENVIRFDKKEHVSRALS